MNPREIPLQQTQDADEEELHSGMKGLMQSVLRVFSLRMGLSLSSTLVLAHSVLGRMIYNLSPDGAEDMIRAATDIACVPHDASEEEMLARSTAHTILWQRWEVGAEQRAILHTAPTNDRPL